MEIFCEHETNSVFGGDEPERQVSLEKNLGKLVRKPNRFCMGIVTVAFDPRPMVVLCLALSFLVD
jgi:hypothetical protein